MILQEEQYELNGKTVVLRSAKKEEAQLLIDYLKTVTGETRFLLMEPDEVKYTIEEEEKFIAERNDAEKGMLILAFVDGEYAGNCSFSVCGPSRRAKHRGDLGIALFQRYTGQGLGRLMLQRLLDVMKEQGLEQAELTVVGGNERAYHLYESLGFKETGRIPRSNKYDDGTYADDILMIKELGEV